MKSEKNISEEMANKVWDILVQETGAPSGQIERDCFVIYVTARQDCPEYRFIGKLGFGGKVRKLDGPWYVYYYPEHKTEEREEIRHKTNAALWALTNTQPFPT